MAGSLTTFIEDVAFPALGDIFPCEGMECATGMGSAAAGSLMLPQSLVALALQALGVPPSDAIGSVRQL